MKFKPYKPERSREEVVAIIDEWGAKQAGPFTGDQILRRQVSIDRLGGHYIRQDAEYYRVNRTLPSKGPKREDFF